MYATPDIGMAGSESAQVNPTEANTQGIPTAADIFTSAAKPVLEGTYQFAAFAESRELKKEAEDISTQLNQGFQNDVPSQGAAQSLSQLTSAVAQGQMSANSMALRANAIRNQAKGLSPIYGPEIDEVFAKNGIDPEGRSLGTTKMNYELKLAEEDIKTVRAWNRDPNMSQYVVYVPGATPEEGNIDVKATLNNVKKTQDAARAAAKGQADTANLVMQSYNNQLGTFLDQYSQEYQRLQTSKGNASNVAVQLNDFQAKFVAGINSQIGYLQQQLGKFPVGSDEYKNIDAAISSTRAHLNDFKTLDPDQLVASNTVAKAVSNQVKIVTGREEINYTTSIKPYVRLGQVAPTSLIMMDNGNELQTIQDKQRANIPLSPYEQALATYGQTSHSWATYQANNLEKPSYKDMDPPAVGMAAKLDSFAPMAWIKGMFSTPADKTKAANMSARLFDGMANTSMFNKNPSNYSTVLQSTANPTYVDEMLSHLPKAQRQTAVNNIVTMTNTALTGAGLPFSAQELRSTGAKVFIDLRTNTVAFGGSKSDKPATGQPGEYSSWAEAAKVWNNGLQTLQNVSSYDANLKGKSRAEIALFLLQESGYPENLIDVKQ